MEARYCTYCGALVLSTGSCETCLKILVKQPSQRQGEDTDESDVDLSSTEEMNPSAVIDVTLPPDHQEMIYGYVERYRGEHVHTFHFRREADNSFLLAASIASSREGPVYFHTCENIKAEGVHMHEIPQKIGQPGFVACLLPTSVLGTEFLLTTRDENNWVNKLLTALKSKRQTPENQKFELQVFETQSSSSRDNEFKKAGRELALFAFDSNVLGTQPNTVEATVRANPSSDFAVVPIKKRVSQSRATRNIEKSLFERLRGRKSRAYHMLGQIEEDDDEVATFETKKPQWSDSIGGWTLDFNGRITMSSKKNFILIPSQKDEIMFGADTIGVRFGKVAKHKFNLDYRFPFSPLSALAVSISMFTSKLIVAW